MPSDPLQGKRDVRELSEYWYVLRRNRWSVLSCLGAGLVLALAVSYFQQPLYQAHALLEIQGLNENFLNMKDFDPTASPGNYTQDTYLQTQLRILQSNALLERVVADRKARSVSEPKSPVKSAPAWPWNRTGPGSAEDDSERPVTELRRNLTTRSFGQTRIVDVLYKSPDPREAADVVNTLCKDFIEQNQELRLAATQRTGQWLNGQLDQMKAALERSEDELQVYASRAGLMITAEKDNVTEIKLGRLQEELSKAQTERIVRESRVNLATSSPPEALPEVLDDATLREYGTKLTELRRQLAELSSTLTPEHYRVVRVQAQIAELQSTLDRERGNVIRRINNDLAAAQRRENLLQAAYEAQAKVLSEQSKKLSHYNLLKRAVDTSRQHYDSLLQKVKEAGVASAIRADNILVVDPAKPPSRPFRPNFSLNAAMGAFGGLFLGIAWSLFRANRQSSIQAPGDAALCFQAPELGVIPVLKIGRALHKPKVLEISDGSIAGIEPRRNGRNDCLELVTWNHKPSLMAESFRVTLASILARTDLARRVFVVTSPNPGEGKTTVITNLAIALAEIRSKVLLIDADLRRPRLGTIFGVRELGLGDILHETSPIEKVPIDTFVQATRIPGLSLLAAGNRREGISSLLYSREMTYLLKQFRQKFDAVLIDAPPMLHIADARILGRLSDGVILVLRPTYTSREAAQQVSAQLALDGTTVLGTILNSYDPAQSPSSGYMYAAYNNHYRPL